MNRKKKEEGLPFFGIPKMMPLIRRYRKTVWVIRCMPMRLLWLADFVSAVSFLAL